MHAVKKNPALSTVFCDSPSCSLNNLAFANHPQRSRQFRLTPLQLGMTVIALHSLNMMPAVAATVPVPVVQPTSPATTNPTAQTTNISNPPTANPTDTANPNVDSDTNGTDSNTPYQYTLPAQTTAADHISRQLDNRTLTDYHNFDQPVATLKRNQPTVGYDARIEQAVPPTLPPAPVAPANPVKAAANEPQQNHQQVLEQLSSDTQNQDPYAPTTTVSANQNAAHQTDNIDVNATINPNNYLPEYQQSTAAVAVPQANQTLDANEKPNLLKRIYNKLLNKGDSINYIDVTIANADPDQQPAKNIKAALEQVTASSVVDFTPSIARLRQIATDAAEAVGYYDTQVSFRLLGGDNVEVRLNKVGEPVRVNQRIVDIRGEGVDGKDALPVYEAIQNDIPPKVGDVFNHGVYKASKATIEGVAQTNGFFDADWLDSSVDIILPDNTADVNLVYDTRQRYYFGDVKIYSIDKQGNLTDDPDKLPVKPELLKQLMTYQKGDPYYQPFVTEFANNLSATRYFNGLDVDVVLPADATTAQGIQFQSTVADASNSASNSNNSNADDSKAKTTDDTLNALANAKTTKTNNTDTKTDGTVAPASFPNNTIQNPDDIAPLEFGVDDSTQERLNAVAKKARDLLNAPEDIELAPDDPSKSRNPLAVIANAISKVAKKIDKPDASALLTARAAQENVLDKMTPEQVRQQKTVPTYVVLNATRPREAQIGIGYETSVGVRLVGKLNNNLVNRNGLQGGISVALSKNDQAVEFSGSYPYKHPLNDKLTGSIGYQHKNVADLANTFETESVYANVARNIYRDTGWNRTMSLRYRADKLSLTEGRYDIQALPYPFNNYDLDFTQQSLLAGYALNKTVADNVLTPTFGYSQRYSLELGADGLLSDTSMAIAKAGATGLYSFGENKKHQVLGRLDLGYLYAKDFAQVPYRLRFFAGGDESIRGYSSDSLAPYYGSQNFLVGGDALAVGSLEYNYQFREGLRAAVFSDFGNAYDTTNEFDNSTRVGIGAGVRWASPIGTVRLDVARGLVGEADPYRLYFFIGSPL